MKYDRNCKIFNLTKQPEIKKPEDFKENLGSSIYITLTDDSMYDRYYPDDTVKIKLADHFPEEADVLLLADDHLLFRKLKNKGDNFQIYRTWPSIEEETYDDVKLLGYATGILRV